ncbi:DEP domain-containing protein 1A isoform X2 [Austrofundulus limnaeus]|uniref:DEP domain-containing protein 1A isoform X2 n=1 Tax=Austrofundulus limnaeus TaxID=52670 RepID=A0A2I4CRB6_AUSLI|nr:PREDICTED: DEP domain-containing protein 1A isoform X2 [Austrofundulus limnaeus]
MNMSTHVITPGPYRATKLWNEVTRLFRSGMPLRKHRQNFRHHASCFTASAAVDWLHQLLRSNNNFGPDVTRQQTVQLLKKFLKNHVIEDVKGRWGTEDLEDNNVLYRFPSTSPLKPIPCPAQASASSFVRRRPSFRDKDDFFKFRSIKKNEETLENVDPALQTQQEGLNQPVEEQQQQRRELTAEDEQEIWRDITLTHLQRILGVSSLHEVLELRCINPQNIIHNMTKVNKHGVVTLEDKTNDLPHWVLSAMKSLANWPKYDSDQPSYPGFERDVFKTVSDYFYSLPRPLLTYELYELFINVLGILQPQCERVAIEALQLCTLLLPPASRRKLQLLMRMMSRISQNVDMPRLHPAIGTRTLMVHTFSGCILSSAVECDLDELLATRLVSFLMDHQQNILSVPEYLLSAISDHIQYLRTVQVPVDCGLNNDGGDPVCVPVPMYAFCKQISGAEFEQQKVESSQKAMEELLEMLLTDQNLNEKDRRKKLKQFQKQYPDIYSRRFPSGRENKAEGKPKIKPPLLNIRKTKAFSIRS